MHPDPYSVKVRIQVHTINSGEVDQSIMDISDDGVDAVKNALTASCCGLDSASVSANTEKVGTDMSTTGNMMEVSNGNTDKVGTDTSTTGNRKEVIGANTEKVGTDNTMAENSNNTDKVGTVKTVVLDANTAQVGTSSLGTKTTQEYKCSAKVGADRSSASISANTNRVGSDDCSNQPGMVQPNDGTYLAVNLYKRKASLALNLLGGAPCGTVAAGSLYDGDPNRISLCHTDFNFSSKRNSMYSFDKVSMKCSCCTEHWNVLERRVLGRHVERRAFVLTDQHFVATAPATTPGEQCLKIFRVETQHCGTCSTRSRSWLENETWECLWAASFYSDLPLTWQVWAPQCMQRS